LKEISQNLFRVMEFYQVANVCQCYYQDKRDKKACQVKDQKSCQEKPGDDRWRRNGIKSPEDPGTDINKELQLNKDHEKRN